MINAHSGPYSQVSRKPNIPHRLPYCHSTGRRSPRISAAKAGTRKKRHSSPLNTGTTPHRDAASILQHTHFSTRPRYSSQASTKVRGFSWVHTHTFTEHCSCRGFIVAHITKLCCHPELCRSRSRRTLQVRIWLPAWPTRCAVPVDQMSGYGDPAVKLVSCPSGGSCNVQ